MQAEAPHISDRFDAILHSVTRASAFLATLGLIAILLMYWIEIFSRYFLNSPTSWAGDMTAFTLCAAIFLMMPEITRTGGHVAVTLLTDLLPVRAGTAARRAIALTGAIVCAFAAYISLGANLNQYFGEIATVSTIAVPKWMISGFITYGLALSALEFLNQGLGRRGFAAVSSIG